jgi:CBS domain containing-hemolysin-like protein
VDATYSYQDMTQGTLDAYLSASQLGITLASIALGWVGEPAFSWLLRPILSRLPGITEAVVHSASLSLAFVTISVLHIVIGEQVPKTLAIRLPEATSLWIAIPLWIFYWIAFPAIWMLNKTANACLRLIGIQPASEHEIAHTEEELRLLLASHRSARLADEKRDLLTNVFTLSERIVRQVMVPRGDVVYLSTRRPLAENLALARSSGHTRFPLCDGDLDRSSAWSTSRTSSAPPAPDDLTGRAARFVPETTPLDKLLARMRSERLNLAAVVDEYGGVSGIVTLEHVIEEIVGPIQDEFDAERPELVDRGGGVYQVSGQCCGRSRG